MKFSTFLTIFLTLLHLTCIRLDAFGAVPATALSRDSQQKAALGQLFAVAEAEEPIYLILIEKNLQRLRVLEHDGELKVVAEYFSATGENSGIKEISGDAKTPEGIYFITKVFIDKEITIFGDKAFHLDYPNFFDIEAGRNGDGIYIHGTNTDLKPNSTNGCVTMVNDDLDDLEKYLNQAVTPVVIVPELKPAGQIMNQQLTGQDFLLAKSLLLNENIKPAKVEYNYLYVINLGSQAVAVADFVYRPHKSSMMRGASRSYLERNTDKSWTTRKRIWRTTPLQIYPDSRVKIAARPFAAEQIQITGQPPLVTSNMIAALEPAGQPEADNTTQENIPVQAPPKPAAKNTAERKPVKNSDKPVKNSDKPVKDTDKPQTDRPAAPKAEPETIASVSAENAAPAKKPEITVAALAPPPAFPKDEDKIRKFVENWRQAWVSKEIKPYINHYDPTFRQGNKDLSQYEAHKENLNRTYEFIRVDISKIKISWTKKGATVSFLQEYQSDRYKTSGSKTLILVYKNDRWKIKREMYSSNKS
jgi:murein L,D-transpeptidase YafK